MFIRSDRLLTLTGSVLEIQQYLKYAFQIDINMIRFEFWITSEISEVSDFIRFISDFRLDFGIWNFYFGLPY